MMLFSAKKIGSALGIAMIFSWYVVLGPLGLVAFLILAYAMWTKTLALAIATGLVLTSPVLLTLLWVPFEWFPAIKKKIDEMEPPQPGEDWWTVRTGPRIVYQAYFS